jgi:hypothetical protein
MEKRKRAEDEDSKQKCHPKVPNEREFKIGRNVFFGSSSKESFAFNKNT